MGLAIEHTTEHTLGPAATHDPTPTQANETRYTALLLQLYFYGVVWWGTVLDRCYTYLSLGSIPIPAFSTPNIAVSLKRQSLQACSAVLDRLQHSPGFSIQETHITLHYPTDRQPFPGIMTFCRLAPSTIVRVIIHHIETCCTPHPLQRYCPSERSKLCDCDDGGLRNDWWIAQSWAWQLESRKDRGKQRKCEAMYLEVLDTGIIHTCVGAR